VLFITLHASVISLQTTVQINIVSV